MEQSETPLSMTPPDADSRGAETRRPAERTDDPPPPHRHTLARLRIALTGAILFLTALSAFESLALWRAVLQLQNVSSTSMPGMLSLQRLRDGLFDLAQIDAERRGGEKDKDFANIDQQIWWIRTHAEEDTTALQKALEALKNSKPASRARREAWKTVDRETDSLELRAGAMQTASMGASLEHVERTTTLVAAGAALGWILGVAVLLFAKRHLETPVQKLLPFLQAAASKDLSQELSLSKNDEFGFLGRAATALVQTLAGVLAHMRHVSVETGAHGKSLTVRAAHTQQHAAEQTQRCAEGLEAAHRIEQAADSLCRIARDLLDQAQQTAASVQQMLAATQQVKAEMEVLRSQVSQSTADIREIDQAAGRLTTVTSGMSAATRKAAQAAATIGETSQVLRQEATAGHAMTEEVVARADRGKSSMEATLTAMGQIRKAADGAVERFGELDTDLSRVDSVVRTIEKIAEKTKILSLNASIVAAQAGDEGRPFGVIATQIQELAAHTGQSTREIRSILEGVARGGKDTSGAVREGVERAAKGETLVRQTSELLVEIHQSAIAAAERLRQIDQLADAQALSAQGVAAEIQEVSAGMASIVEELHAEEHRTDAVRSSLEEIEQVAICTNDAMREQTQGAEMITRAVMDVSEVAQQADSAVASIGASVTSLRSDLEILHTNAREELAMVERVCRDGEKLSSLAEKIRQEVDAFVLPA